MVQAGDFEAHLVDVKTKAPFKEHYHEGKVYVETPEPGAEYFIAVRKMKASGSAALVCRYIVDGKDLGHNTCYPGPAVRSEPDFNGIWSRVNGVSSEMALMFVKPSVRDDDEGSPVGGPATMMGQLRIDVYQAHPTGLAAVGRDHVPAAPFEAEPLSRGSSVAQTRKYLRTCEGKTTVSKAVGTAPWRLPALEPILLPGPLLYSIPLNYCSAVGLIFVGVLPKPPARTFHRMLHPPGPATPHDGSNSSGRKPVAKFTVKKITSDDGKVLKRFEVFDLTLDDGDDDGEGRPAVVSPPAKKRVRLE